MKYFPQETYIQQLKGTKINTINQSGMQQASTTI